MNATSSEICRWYRAYIHVYLYAGTHPALALNARTTKRLALNRLKPQYSCPIQRVSQKSRSKSQRQRRDGFFIFIFEFQSRELWKVFFR